jgi:predicted RNase H-like nuclease (RuvC/YqgF family)
MTILEIVQIIGAILATLVTVAGIVIGTGKALYAYAKREATNEAYRKDSEETISEKNTELTIKTNRITECEKTLRAQEQELMQLRFLVKQYEARQRWPKEAD